MSYGQSWDDSDWTDSIEKAILVQDTFIFNGFRVIDRRPNYQRVLSMDTLYEETYRKIKIESLKSVSDSTIVLKSRKSDFRTYQQYDGHSIKASLGLDTGVLYVGEILETDTIWLDTMVFTVLPLKRLMSYTNLDSICSQKISSDYELFGGLGQGWCNYIVPCKITKFKVDVSGSVNETFEMHGNTYSQDLIDCFKRVKTGDEIYFYDILGKSSKSPKPIAFNHKKMVVKDCSL